MSGYGQTVYVNDSITPPISGPNLNKTEAGVNAALGYDSFQVIRDLGVPNNSIETVLARGHTTCGDGGAGLFFLRTGTFVDDDGITLVPTGGDGSIAWVRDIDGPVCTAWFGIDGIDDSSSVQSAVDAAASLGGALYLSPKPHRFSQVELRDGLTITSDEAQVRLLSSDGAFWNKDTAPYSLSDVSISGVEFIRDEYDGSGEIAIVIRAPDVGRHRNISIKDCTFTRILAYYIWSCDGITTRNCTFQDTMYSDRTPADYIISASPSDEPVVDIDGNTQSNCMDTNQCTSLDISNNNFKSVLSVGHFDETAGGAFNNNIVYETAYSAMYFRNQAGDTSGVVITGNVFVGIGHGAIVVDRFGGNTGFNGRGVTITGNTINGYCVYDSGSHRAVHVTNESLDPEDFWSDVVVSSNSILTNDQEWPNLVGFEKGDSIWCTGTYRGLLISNNACSDTPSHGIYVGGRNTFSTTSEEDSVIISNNILSRCGGSVRYSNEKDRGAMTVTRQLGLVKVTGNIIRDLFVDSPTVPLFQSEYCYDLVLTDNHFSSLTNIPQYSVAVFDSGMSLISGNVFRGYSNQYDAPILIGGDLSTPVIHSNHFTDSSAGPYLSGYSLAGANEDTQGDPRYTRDNLSGYTKTVEIGGVTITRVWDGVRQLWTPQQPTMSGSTEERPTGVNDGFMFYDFTLNLPVWWRTTEWRDATGSAV